MARLNPKLDTIEKERVIARLRNRPVWLEMKEVAEETGIGIEWLWALIKGKIADPGVCRVTTINQFLDSRIPK